MRRLSFVMPAYNEAAIIRRTIKLLKKNFPQAEIIVSDDGSSDDTSLACDGLGAVVLWQPHRGYASAVYHGMGVASGDFIVVVDADIPFFLEQIRALLEKPADYDVLVCSRIAYNYVSNGFFRAIRSRLYNLFATKLLSLAVMDINGVKVISRSALKGIGLRGSGWIFGAELIYKFKRKGRKIREDSLFFHRRASNKSHFTLRSVVFLFSELLKLRAGTL